MALFSSSKMLKNRKWEVGNGNESHEDTYSALSVLEKIQAGVHLHMRSLATRPVNFELSLLNPVPLRAIHAQYRGT